MNRTITHVTVETPQKSIPRKPFSSEPRPSGRYGLFSDGDSDEENALNISLSAKMRSLNIDRIHNSTSVEYSQSLRQSKLLNDLAKCDAELKVALKESKANTTDNFNVSFKKHYQESPAAKMSTPDIQKAYETKVNSAQPTVRLDEYKSPERFSSLSAYLDYTNVVQEASFLTEDLKSSETKTAPRSLQAARTNTPSSGTSFAGFPSTGSLFSKPSCLQASAPTLFSLLDDPAVCTASNVPVAPPPTFTNAPIFSVNGSTGSNTKGVKINEPSEVNQQCLFDNGAKRSTSLFTGIVNMFSNFEKALNNEIKEFNAVQGSLASAGRRWIREKITITMQHSTDAKKIAHSVVAFSEAHESGYLDDFDGPIDFSTEPTFDLAKFQSWFQWNVIAVYLIQLNEDPALYQAVLDSLATLVKRWPQVIDIISAKLFSSSLVLRFDYEGLEALIASGRKSGRAVIQCEAGFVRLLLRIHLIADQSTDLISGTALLKQMLREIVESAPQLVVTPVLVHEFTRMYGTVLKKTDQQLFMAMLRYAQKVTKLLRSHEEGANELMVGFSAQYTEYIRQYIAQFDSKRQQKSA
ncbi:hypothetical protein QR680_005607 [Steinernema hermaphroditum]|uniref:Uncharacterized protein n=1 Tax=Steinernema hermaphroditum TaxID=289476 RepID=A0AA39LVY9_9BILA|nr:hypothetical protein QR680_005607 [Steinernema hermaphroditum]